MSRGSAGNWETCYMSRYLQEVLGLEAPPPPREVLDRGNLAEDEVAKVHPEWDNNRDRHFKVSLPSMQWDSLKGFPVRKNAHVAYPDFIDQHGGPVEVKGMNGHAYRKINSLADFINGYKYQLEYVLQLAGYIYRMQKPGRFKLYNHGDNTGWGKGEMKEIPMDVEMATMIYEEYLAGGVKVKSCKFCKMESQCRAYKAAIEAQKNQTALV